MSTKKPAVCIDCGEVRWVNRPGRNERCKKCAAHVSGSQTETRVRRSESQRLAMAKPETKERHRQKARANAARQKNNDEFRVKISLSQGGDGNLSRMNSSYKREDANWRKDVKERDNYTCQSCGNSDKLHAHHIKPKSAFPNLRHDLSNGITLCHTCHLEEHRNMKINNGITKADLLSLLGA